MAQLVERTLGKGEVPSSILGISTSYMHMTEIPALGHGIFFCLKIAKAIFFNQ